MYLKKKRCIKLNMKEIREIMIKYGCVNVKYKKCKI